MQHSFRAEDQSLTGARTTSQSDEKDKLDISNVSLCWSEIAKCQETSMTENELTTHEEPIHHSYTKADSG